MINRVSGRGALTLQDAQIVAYTAASHTASPHLTTINDFVIGAETSSGGGGALTVNLATASVIAGRVIIVTDVGGGAAGGGQAITIATEGAELINGAATNVINVNYDQRRLVCDGTNWFTF